MFQLVRAQRVSSSAPDELLKDDRAIQVKLGTRKLLKEALLVSKYESSAKYS